MALQCPKNVLHMVAILMEVCATSQPHSFISTNSVYVVILV
jgi:hypothetical protein